MEGENSDKPVNEVCADFLRPVGKALAVCFRKAFGVGSHPHWLAVSRQNPLLHFLSPRLIGLVSCHPGTVPAGAAYQSQTQ